MKTTKRPSWGLVLALLLSLAVVAVLAVQTSAEAGGYRLDWFTLDTGGAVSTSTGGYALSGTTGQPEAGSSSNGGYTLSGGFWPGAPLTPPDYEIYLPLVRQGQ